MAVQPKQRSTGEETHFEYFPPLPQALMMEKKNALLASIIAPVAHVKAPVVPRADSEDDLCDEHVSRLEQIARVRERFSKYWASIALLECKFDI